VPIFSLENTSPGFFHLPAPHLLAQPGFDTSLRGDNKMPKSRKSEKKQAMRAGAKPDSEPKGKSAPEAPLPGADALLKPWKYPRTDAGNAELFGAIFENQLRYDYTNNRWLIWREHWWEEDINGQIVRDTKYATRRRLKAAMTIEDDVLRKAEIKWARQSESLPRLKSMLELSQAERPLADSGTEWDSRPFLLGVKNGVIDLRSGKLREGRPSDKITLHSNIEFDPNAQCPRWGQFLFEIFAGDTELIEFVQRAVGYSLTGDTSEQVIFLCYGTGANGKSTFLEVLREVAGGYGYNLPFSAFELRARSTIPNDVAALDGRRFVTAIETNESVELNEARMKALTGSDRVTARHLYKEFFTFIPRAKFWLAFNHRPYVADDSQGFWRRIRLIPFLVQFPEETADKELMPILKAEAAGILAWAVRGALAWKNNGLGMPSAVKQASEAYREESDPLEDFIVERCTTAPEVQCAAADLWEEYKSWATENLVDRPLDRRAFSRRLETRGFNKIRTGHDRTWTWRGISVEPVENAVEALLGSRKSARADADVKNPIVTQ
jgi:putative DNA primase/helicase